MTLLYVAWLVQGLQSAFAEVKGVKVTIRPIGLPPVRTARFVHFLVERDCTLEKGVVERRFMVG
jgi:hypothetical protein